jgi:Rod binding domain-containing protein
MQISDLASMQYQNRSLQVPTASHSAPANGKAIDKGSDLYKQCEEFQAVFVKMMLDEMRKSVDKSGLVEGGMTEDVFSDMLYDEYSKSMSHNANFGLADQLYTQLSRTGYQS